METLFTMINILKMASCEQRGNSWKKKKVGTDGNLVEPFDGLRSQKGERQTAPNVLLAFDAFDMM